MWKELKGYSEEQGEMKHKLSQSSMFIMIEYYLLIPCSATDQAVLFNIEKHHCRQGKIWHVRLKEKKNFGLKFFHELNELKIKYLINITDK